MIKLMKIIKEHKRIIVYNERIHNIYVTESSTNWYVTMKRVGWALPHLLNYKVTKKAAKTADEAISITLKQI